jgi:diacylglycerol O-acyltransferase
MVTSRTSPVEAIMWRAGQDPRLRMTVGNFTVLDRPPEPKALVDRLSTVAETAPRLRWHLDDPSRVRGRPLWIDDGPVDLTSHVRTMAVPAPGGMRAVLDLIELLEHHPFRPDRSPWDITIIEGLGDGRGALYLRADHVLTDGLGGMALLDLLYDEAGWRSTISPAATRAVDEPVMDAPAGRRPGTLTFSVDLTRAARPVVGGVTAGIDAARTVNPLGAAVRGVQRGIDLVNSMSRQTVVTGGALSPLCVGHPTSSRFEVTSVPGARHAALALGGSRNDLVVAAVAAGLGAYHERLGMSCPQLRLAMPARLHRDQGAGGNWFSLTRVEVPTSASHPVPQFGVISERLAQARREPAIRFTGAVAAALNRLPARLLIPALHAQVSSIDFVATAVPGFRRRPHVCGAAVEASYPFGPRLGCLMNVVASGNNGQIDIGIALDADAIDEPDLLMECVTGTLRGLVVAAGELAEPPGEEVSRPGP